MHAGSTRLSRPSPPCQPRSLPTDLQLLGFWFSPRTTLSAPSFCWTLPSAQQQPQAHLAPWAASCWPQFAAGAQAHTGRGPPLGRCRQAGALAEPTRELKPRKTSQWSICLQLGLHTLCTSAQGTRSWPSGPKAGSAHHELHLWPHASRPAYPPAVFGMIIHLGILNRPSTIYKLIYIMLCNF